MKCLAASILLTTLFVLFAPGFLFTGNTPRKADAVILFVGPDNEARLGMAEQLIKEGYARYLVIPSSGELFRRDAGGQLTRIAGNQPRSNLFLRVRIAASYKKYYENTHIEALEARRLMDELGLSSALLVSSAYHMRRIWMVAGRVFAAKNYAVSCTPTWGQTAFTPADWLNKERRRVIFSEYLKMAWFLVYGLIGS